jgi:hypothetical protein
VNVLVGLVDAVSSIEDDMVLIGVDKSADGVACICVVPAVGAQENDSHDSSLTKLRVTYRLVNKIDHDLLKHQNSYHHEHQL